MIEVHLGPSKRNLSWPQWEEMVRQGMIPPDTKVRFEPVTGQEFVHAKDLESYRSMVHDPILLWRKAMNRRRAPLLTALLVGVQIRIWWLALGAQEASFVESFANWTPAVLLSGEVLRMLSMGFIQTDLIHLGLNMIWLAYVGTHLERFMGRSHLLLLYVLAVLCGSACSVLLGPTQPSIGASGGVFGLIGCAVFVGWLRPELIQASARTVFGWALAPYLIVMLISGLFNAQTDNWAHLGGLAAGIMTAIFFHPQHSKNIQAASLAVIAALLGLFFLAGPRLQPITTSSTHDFFVPAPAGWKPGVTATGLQGHKAPAGMAAWGMRIVFHEDRTTAQQQQRFVHEATRAWPEATFTSSQEEDQAGTTATHLTGRLSADRDVHYIIIDQQNASIESVWETRPDLTKRLAPLHRRLQTKALERLQGHKAHASGKLPR